MEAGNTAAAAAAFSMQTSGQGQTNLYVGNLDPKVNEAMLRDIFQTVGPVGAVKIIPDVNFQHGGYSFAFVEFFDHTTAELALNTFDERVMFGVNIKVNWASAGGAQKKEDTSGHQRIFVGDLSSEVTNEVLLKAFVAFGSCSDAQILIDPVTGRSRGYGFVAFRNKEDAQNAINQMNGEWLGSRTIRCNWASQKNDPPPSAPSLKEVVHQSANTNTTVYCGNLSPDTVQDHLLPFFQDYGHVEEVRMQSDKGYAFVRFDTHQNAANAIVGVHGKPINGRYCRCSWGKELKPLSVGPQNSPGVYGANPNSPNPNSMITAGGTSYPAPAGSGQYADNAVYGYHDPYQYQQYPQQGYPPASGGQGQYYSQQQYYPQ